MMSTLKTLSTFVIATAFAATVTTPALAQGTDIDAPVAGLSTGELVSEDLEGDSYIGATFGDWEHVCVRNPDGEDPCQMYQMLVDDAGTPTAEISIFPLPAGQEAAAGASVLTPLETLLTAQLVMQIDNGQAKRYPFTFCTAIGCVARIGFTTEELNQFRAGARAVWSLVPVAAPDQRVDLTMSLIGFTAAFAGLTPEAE